MTPSAARRSVAAGAVALLLTLTAVGCSGSSADGSAAVDRPAANSRPAVKETCPDVAWQPPASVRVEQGARELVPFGPTLLGVDSTWRGNGFIVQTVAGGYVDDLTEPYDDLQPSGTIAVSGDPAAEVMRGTFQGRPVLMVLWRDLAQAVPCDVHVFLVQDADPVTEDILLGGLR